MSILSKKAVLAILNVGGWEGRKRDDEASSVVHEHFNATKDSGNYNKTLFDLKHDAWKRIIKARTALREYHYTNTLPWPMKGAQLLTSAMYLDFNSEIIKLVREYEEAAEDFVENHYSTLKARAKKERNGLYREEDYPSHSELKRKFYAEVKYLPVPDSGNIIVDLHNAEVARIKNDTEAMMQEAVEKAQAEVWIRLYEPVLAMSEALADPKRRFHDTLVSNVQEMVERAPSMNMTDDPKLSAMVAEVKKSLTRNRADALRDDPDKRLDQASKAAALAKKMKSLMPMSP